MKFLLVNGWGYDKFPILPKRNESTIIESPTKKSALSRGEGTNSAYIERRKVIANFRAKGKFVVHPNGSYHSGTGFVTL